MADNERSDVTTASTLQLHPNNLMLTSLGMLQRSKSHSQGLYGERQIHYSQWLADLYDSLLLHPGSPVHIHLISLTNPLRCHRPVIRHHGHPLRL